MGTLYYGDNLDILTRYIADESVDLVHLDPPFNSAQNYNAFFQEKDGTAEVAEGNRRGSAGGRVAAAQIQAFEDTWEWNHDSRAAYDALSLRSDKLGSVMRAFMEFLGPNDRCGGGEKARPRARPPRMSAGDLPWRKRTRWRTVSYA